MNEFFSNLQKEARTLKLSKEEKQAMRVHLYKVMDESPAYTPAQKNALQDFAARKPIPSMYHWFSPRFSVPAAIVLLVGLSGGTAFAAQSALPGDPLYTIKVNVNEPVQTALATTPEAKAQVNASIATTRLEEAETLASQGTLDATTSEELAGNFAAHATAAEANTVTVAAVDPGTAAELGTTFSSTLSAHGAILAQLASDSATTSVKESSGALAVKVLSLAALGDEGQPAEQGGQAGSDATVATTTGTEASSTGSNATSSATSTVEASTTSATSAPMIKVSTFVAIVPEAEGTGTASGSAASSTSGTTSTSDTNGSGNNNSNDVNATPANSSGDADNSVVALALGTEASSTLSQVETDFAAIAPSLDASTTAQIRAQITGAAQMLAQGNNALISGDGSTARDAFSKVLRFSVRLDAFFKAGQKFNVSFLTSLLN